MIKLSIDLPKEFFKEEELSGHLVTTQMKEIWAVELDLLAQFQAVCQKYDLKYFANAGTLLGAVRHKGFIPWDDDIDITMFREDYERLCEVAPKEFKEPYFWQTEDTDRGSLRGHAQLRRSDTTGILNAELEAKKPINQGIFIDIFPYDAVTEDKEAFEAQREKALALKKKARRIAKATDQYRFSNYKFPKNILSIPLHIYYKYISKVDYQEIYREFEETCAQFNDQDTEFISCLSFDFAPVHHQYRKDYEESVMVPFETLEIPVPKNYHHALTKRFGNYQEFVKGGAYHGGILFDTDKPYTDYLK